jgi:endogenous inhibitor of DNA gyrase (YacG/DUF329 family)
MDDPFVPFCSERCRLLDLGCWLDEGYRVSVPLPKEDACASGNGEDSVESE